MIRARWNGIFTSLARASANAFGALLARRFKSSSSLSDSSLDELSPDSLSDSLEDGPLEALALIAVRLCDLLTGTVNQIALNVSTIQR